VKKLIFAVTAPDANAVVRDDVTGWNDMVMRKDHTALMVDTAEKMYSEAYLRKNRKFFPLIARLTKPKDYDRFLKNAYAILRFDARAELAKIVCPTLILAGKNDHVVGNDAANELHGGIAGSDLYVYEGLGHGAYEEAKDFYGRVLDFCNRH
jgi:pimeloyl-ACP methyl ester carboxylesterase